MSDTQLIDTRRTRDPSPAREKRLSGRIAEAVGFRLLRGGGKRYAEAVIEGLGTREDPKRICQSCERPYVQEWAVREMGRAMERALGNPTVQMQIVNLIGAAPEEAREAISAIREVQALDEVGRIELFRRALEDAGWTCLPPSANATDGANGHAAG